MLSRVLEVLSSSLLCEGCMQGLFTDLSTDT
jgi:hypothetical protein